MKNPVFCALDTQDVDVALSFAEKLKGHIGGLKLGLEFYMANGAEGYRKIADLGVPLFLDVKLHDIPNTVAGGIKSLLSLKPNFITIHTSGGAAMMRAASDAVAEHAAKNGGDCVTKLLGVTVLTSLDTDDLASVGQATDVAAQVLRLAKLAKENGLDGVICSPAEVPLLRRELGADFILMVPGIRPSWSASNDQKRIMTPDEAMEAGATYLVIGRPITKAENPTEAAIRIEAELKKDL